MEAPSIPPIPIPQPQKTKRFPVVIIVVLLLVGLVAGGLIGYAVSYSDFNGKLSSMQAQLQGYSQNATYFSYPNATYIISSNVSLSSLYQEVKSSVVVIQDLVPVYNIFGTLVGYTLQQGSGFITSVNNQLVIVTNNHVIQDAINETVTFADGDTYPAKVLGSDPQADLAALTITPMPSGLTPLTLVSSDTLQVGEPVVAVGSPYGLSGTLTTGVISALGRTITEESSSSSTGQTIPDIIQTSTAINPGNSGGPLLDYAGEVVGITTADISNSQGLGFAIPSDTIIRELSSLVTSGSYSQHPTINAVGTDMNYQIAQAMGTSVTYGWLVETVSSNNGIKGGSTQASILGSNVILGGDIITAINGARITNTDDLLSYLEQHTLPGQTESFTVIRNGQTQTVSVTIGKVS
ncbi:MAG: trypsin-like peptidase domain-containing protein [Candidatus Bathyarchaeia archaeon]|jgi:S1-C subfamily serine protease